MQWTFLSNEEEILLVFYDENLTVSFRKIPM